MKWYDHSVRPAKLMPREVPKGPSSMGGDVRPPMEMSPKVMPRVVGSGPSPSGKSMRPPLEKAGKLMPRSA